MDLRSQMSRRHWDPAKLLGTIEDLFRNELVDGRLVRTTAQLCNVSGDRLLEVRHVREKCAGCPHVVIFSDVVSLAGFLVGFLNAIALDPCLYFVFVVGGSRAEET